MVLALAPPPPAVGAGLAAVGAVAVAWHPADLNDDALLCSATKRLRAAARPEVGPAQAWPVPDAAETWAFATTQKALAAPVARALYRGLWASADARQRTQLQAQSAPGTGPGCSFSRVLVPR